MPGFSISLPHTLGLEGAKERLHDAMSHIQEKYANQLSDMEEQWEGDVLMFSFGAFGFRISGTLTVFEDKVDMAVKLPIAAMMFKGKIEGSLRHELEKVLK